MQKVWERAGSNEPYKVVMFKSVLVFSASVSRRSACGSVFRGSFCKMENGTLSRRRPRDDHTSWYRSGVSRVQRQQRGTEQNTKNLCESSFQQAGHGHVQAWHFELLGGRVAHCIEEEEGSTVDRILTDLQVAFTARG